MKSLLPAQNDKALLSELF